MLKLENELYELSQKYIKEDIRKAILSDNSISEDNKVHILTELEEYSPEEDFVKSHLMLCLEKTLALPNPNRFPADTKWYKEVSSMINSAEAIFKKDLVKALKEESLEKLEEWKKEIYSVRNRYDSIVASLSKADAKSGKEYGKLDANIRSLRYSLKDFENAVNIFEKDIKDASEPLVAEDISAVENFRLIAAGDIYKVQSIIAHMRAKDIGTDKKTISELKKLKDKCESLKGKMLEIRSAFDLRISRYAEWIVNKAAPPKMKDGKEEEKNLWSYVNPMTYWYELRNLGAVVAGMSATHLASVGAVIIGIAIAAFLVYKYFVKKKCKGQTGIPLKECQLKSANAAIKKIKSQKNKCEETDSPSQCKKELNVLIRKWKERKKAILES